MVKELIKGLLKKGSKEGKEEGKEEKKGEAEVPDELPALADDSTKDSKDEPKAEDKEEKKEGDKKEGAEVPDELPALAEDTAKEEKKDEVKEGFPDHFPNLKEDKGDKEEADKQQEVPKKEAKEGDEDTGFFSNLAKITKRQGINKRLLDKNLYEGMKNYFSERSLSSIKPTTREALEKEVIGKLDNLKVLEKKWYDQKDLIEKNKQILLENEKEIQVKSEELKLLLKKLSFYEDAPVGKYFRSDDGVIVKNIYELLNLLKVMDEPVFKGHMGDGRNDFALWIRKVIGDNELAKKLYKVKSKEEMIFTLENAATGRIDDAIAKNIFKPKKGAIIKDPKELSIALRHMDNETFSSHVNRDKNEFSTWVSGSFGDEELASRIEKVKDKEEMIGILEEFFKNSKN